ncbi:MAG: hypothetical protein ACR2N2_04060 [Acidimicrobiia bacterium]
MGIAGQHTIRSSHGVARWLLVVAIGVVALGALVVVFVVAQNGGTEEPLSAPSSTSGNQNEGQESQAESQATDTESQEANTAGDDGDAVGGEASGSGSTETFGDSATAAALKNIAPAYGADGDTAVSCIDSNVAGGFTDEELRIIHDDPNAATWPPGLAEKFASVLETCIPLEPFYKMQFGAFQFENAACVDIMTSYVLAAYSWTVFLLKGILDADQYAKLQAEFDAYVGAGYAANNCFST